MNLSRVFLFSQAFAVASAYKSIRGAQQRELVNTRIIGGSGATEGRYPYAVSLQDNIGHFCGGSLIAKDVVLSAAHCMQTQGGYFAVVGRHELNTTNGDELIVKTEIPHPSYDPSTTNNDFMILILDRPTSLDVDLVTVSQDIVPIDTAVTVMGWGDVHPSDEIQMLAEELMETEVFVISNEECDQSSGNIGGTEINGTLIGGWEFDYHNEITENMMCAKDSGEDSCQGDSGGPLVIVSDSGADLQVGVVSWGISCAHKDFPGVYARTSSQYDWIRQNVCEGSSDPPAYFDCESIVKLVDEDGWATVVEEDFTNGFGLFDKQGNNGNHYLSAMERPGVVRIANGEGGYSVLKSNQMSWANTAYTRFRVTFSFYAIAMEDTDSLCLDYEINGGAVTGEKCWSSIHAFDMSRWYDDVSFEFAASNSQTLGIRFRVEGDDVVDEVLLDSVTIQGQQ